MATRVHHVNVSHRLKRPGLHLSRCLPACPFRILGNRPNEAELHGSACHQMQQRLGTFKIFSKGRAFFVVCERRKLYKACVFATNRVRFGKGFKRGHAELPAQSIKVKHQICIDCLDREV
jgi:hypothetical protein